MNKPQEKPQEKPMFERIALIGIGLIGSSISHAARRANLAGEIVGSARTPATVETAMRLGLIEQGYVTAAEAAEGADLVILCTPVGLCGPIAKEISRSLKPGAILTDVGSVKGAIVKDVSPHVPQGVHFVAGHPIAGTEQSGPEAGFAELFDGLLKTRVDRLAAEPEDLETLVEAITLYHMIIEGVLALTGQHFIIEYNTSVGTLPGFVEGFSNVARDEHRHIAFGVRFLTDMVAKDDRYRDAIQRMLQESLPVADGVLKPPWPPEV